MTARQLMNELNLDKQVSVCTIKRILNKNGLFGRVAAKKPAINRTQRIRRIKFAKNLNSWEKNEIRKIVFSDETKLELCPNTREYVTRPKNKRIDKKYTTKPVKFGKASIMLYGFIKYDGSRKLVQINENLNSQRYQDILKENYLPSINEFDIYQQDGAPCHKSKSTIKFMEDNNIKLLSDWPSQSPDLNIIENIWSQSKESVKIRKPTNKQELWEFSLEEFHRIQQKIFKNCTIAFRIGLML